MHVIIVYDFGSVNGGAAQVAIAEALELAKRGHRVTYFCAVGPVDNRLAAAGVEVLCLGQQDILGDSDKLSAVRRGVWNTAAALALRSVLSQARSDRSVVHIHGWTKALSASVLSVVRDTKVPYVVTAHDYFSVCPNGGYYNYKAQSVCRLVPMSLGCMASDCDARGYHHKLFRVVRQVVAVATSDIQGQLPHVIYISDFSRSVLLPSFSGKTKWYHLPNPVNAEQSNRIHASLNRHFLYVGRISAEKGVALFCRAATAAGVPARVVGDGPLGKTLRYKWPSVEFLGWMAPGQVKAMMSEARALVFPSEWYETFGLVVAEALSMGIPVVASRQTGAAELIIDGENGRLIDSGDCNDLVRAMISLADDAIVEQMSISAFSRFWRDPSTLASHCAELERVYTAVIENADR